MNADEKEEVSRTLFFLLVHSRSREEYMVSLEQCTFAGEGPPEPPPDGGAP